MNWNVENPMVIDPCGKLKGIRYEDGNWDDEDVEEFYRVNMEIDTRKLTIEEENLLYAVLDDIACYRCGKDFYGDYRGELEVESVELEGFGADEVFGKITLKGNVTEETYDEIWKALDEFSGRIVITQK